MVMDLGRGDEGEKMVKRSAGKRMSRRAAEGTVQGRTVCRGRREEGGEKRLKWKWK